MDSWQEWLSLFVTGAVSVFVIYLNNSINKRHEQEKETTQKLNELEKELIAIRTRMEDNNIKELNNAIIVLQSQFAAIPKRNVDRRNGGRDET